MNFTKDVIGGAQDAISSLLPMAGAVLNSNTNIDHPTISCCGKTVKNPVTTGSYNIDAIDMDYVNSVILPEDSWARSQQDTV